jgi:hypothetical protein
MASPFVLLWSLSILAQFLQDEAASTVGTDAITRMLASTAMLVVVLILLITLYSQTGQAVLRKPGPSSPVFTANPVSFSFVGGSDLRWFGIEGSPRKSPYLGACRFGCFR